jgi:hypothetical protein
MEVPNMPRITTLLGIVTLSAVAAVLAQQPQPSPESMPKPSSDEKTFSGEIASVDRTARTLAVKELKPDAPEKSMTFTVDEETKIQSKMAASGSALKLEDLEAGDRVLVRYTSSAGRNDAESIEVLTPPATSN